MPSRPATLGPLSAALLLASAGPLVCGKAAGQDLGHFAVLEASGLYAQAEPAPTAPPPPEREEFTREGLHLVELFAEGQVVFLTGHVSARELTIGGNRFHFQDDLDAGIGEKGGGGVRFNISEEDILELHALYFYLRGSTTLEGDRTFNGTTFAGGTTLESRPDWFELRLSYLRRLVDIPWLGSSFWFLFGVDYHYVHWKFAGTVAPGSVLDDPQEDFQRQTFPLPVFGLRYLFQLDPAWALDVRADAFRANHWRHWADEGGPIYTSSTIVNVSGDLRWRPLRWLFLQAGYAFRYYTLDEVGPEDGNHLLTREHGPTLALGFSF